jgi:hypothetical protein
MRIVETSKPEKMTVGDLISELCRWPDHAEVAFRGPLRHEEYNFYRVVGRSTAQIEIELASEPLSVPLVPR